MITSPSVCSCACTCTRVNVCVSVERGRESACVSEWNIDGGGRCVWGSARCSVTVDNHSLIYLSKTLSSHTAPAKQFLLSLPPSSPSLSFSPSLSLYLQLQPRGLFLSRTKTLPTSPPSPFRKPLLSPHRFYPSLSFSPHSHPFLFLCWELESGNEQAVNTHHLSQCMLLCICWQRLVRWRLWYKRPEVWATVPDRETWNKDAPQVERQFDQCTVGCSLNSSALKLQQLKCAQLQSMSNFYTDCVE